MTRLRAIVFAVLLALGSMATMAMAQPGAGATPDGQFTAPPENGRRESAPPDYTAQYEQLRYAIQRLPVAAGLAVILALRPRRRGTPPRQAQVVQTQIILAVVGAVVMLVVGTSLARAFGIVGAAGLVRYRAKIDDPKDAGVMLSTLAIGLASGVGLWMLAAFSTAFVLAVLWLVESFEPQARHLFTLNVKAGVAPAPGIPFPSLATKTRGPRSQLPNEQLADWPDERIHFGARIEMAKWPDGEMAKFTSAAPRFGPLVAAPCRVRVERFVRAQRHATKARGQGGPDANLTRPEHLFTWSFGHLAI
jgi:hypothetical protein